MKKLSDLTFPQKILEGVCFAVPAGTKLAVLGTFAVIEWCGVSARPMVGWLTPASLACCGVLGAGFMISGIGFALRQKN